VTFAYIADAYAAIREIAISRADPTLRYAFDFTEDTDVGDTASGPLFKQDQDFLLLEAEVDQGGRAGPSIASPRRYFGSLFVSVLTKSSGKDLTHLRNLEDFSSWYADKTIRGIRFRTFTPTGNPRLLGFTAYTGVINFDFELQPR
jgi:hypothetical protein